MLWLEPLAYSSQSLQVAAPTRASGAALLRALRRRAHTVAWTPSMAVFGPGPSTNRPIDAEVDDGDDVASDDSEISFDSTAGGTINGDDDLGNGEGGGEKDNKNKKL